MTKRTVFIISGTRPEAIKLAPVYLALKSKGVDVHYVATGQHAELHDHVTSYFGIPHFLTLNTQAQDGALTTLCSNLLRAFQEHLGHIEMTDIVVQGDTASAFCGAQFGFLNKKNVVHIEAGLRSFDKTAPFPEEIFRQQISVLADKHMCPTEDAKMNLLKEGVNPDSIFITGNTVVDAIRLYRDGENNVTQVEDELGPDKFSHLKHSPFVLATVHRRENHGAGLIDICKMLRDASEHTGLSILVPMHPNPDVRSVIQDQLGQSNNIILSEGLSYPTLLWAMSKSKFILSDSGGIQEEAPSFGKNILILRDKTERPEVVSSGWGKLVGNAYHTTLAEVKALNAKIDRGDALTDGNKNPFGDGFASEQILGHLNI